MFRKEGNSEEASNRSKVLNTDGCFSIRSTGVDADDKIVKDISQKHLAGSTETAVVNHMHFNRSLLIHKQKECCDDLHDAPKIKALVKLEINTPKDIGERNILQRTTGGNTQTDKNENVSDKDSHAIWRRKEMLSRNFQSRNYDEEHIHMGLQEQPEKASTEKPFRDLKTLNMDLRVNIPKNATEDKKLILRPKELSNNNSQFYHEDEPIHISFEELRSKRDLDIKNELQKCNWYWGPLSTVEAATILQGKPHGSFLVRDSCQERYVLSVTCTVNGFITHRRIEHGEHRKFSFELGSLEHLSIKEFIEQIIRKSQTGDIQCVIYPCGQKGPPMPVHFLHPVPRTPSDAVTSVQVKVSDPSKRHARSFSSFFFFN